MQRLFYASLALVLLIVLGGFAAPRFARVELEIMVDAPASVVFAQANDLRRLSLWAPVDAGDSTAVLSFEGPARGEGASVSWDGSVVGSGIIVLAESVPYEYVSYILNPGEPGEAVSWLALEATATGTRVRRGFEHDYGYNLVGRYFGLMWTGVVKRDYAQSLERLKALVEGLPRTDFADIDIEHAFVEARRIAYLPTSSRVDAAAVSTALGQAYFEILAWMDREGLIEDGAPLSIKRGFAGTSLLLDAAIPIRGAGIDEPSASSSRVRIGNTYEGEVIRARHTGSYARLVDTHRKLSSYLAATGLKVNGDAWEEYVTDPSKVPESELTTVVVYPVRTE